MLLKNIDLNFYPSLPMNYKFSADGQLCIPAGQITYILSNSILNPDLVSNPPVPSKFRPGDENKIDYRNSENRADWKGYNGSDEEGGSSDSGSEEVSDEEDVAAKEEEVEGDVDEDKARPEFQFHWQRLEIIEDDKEEDVMKGGATFQVDQTFKEGFARQLEWSPLGAGKHKSDKVSLSCDGDPVVVSLGMAPGYEPHAVLWYDRIYNLPSQPPEMLLAVIQHDGAEFFGVSLDQKKGIAVRRQYKVQMELPARLAGYTFSDPLWANYLDLNIASTNGALAIFKVDLADLTKSILYKASIPYFKNPTIISNDPEIPHPNPWKRDFIDILDEKRDAFIQEWKTIKASCQVYGMTYSPLGGILTVCYRMKPEGVLEYPIKERERCTLSWEMCRTWMDMFDSSKAVGSAKPFTLFGVSGEAFISDIRFLLDPEEAEESFGKMEEVIAKGMQESEKRLAAVASTSTASANQQLLPHKLSGVQPSDLADRLSLALFNSTEAILLRARNLLGLLKTNKIAPKKPGLLTAQTGITRTVCFDVRNDYGF
ncbi:hypothetical protein ABW20_dc0100908 [Dactylellina cionopaga]|nr:hypothetical protein ABW20_dc0100908 [Dactylellina cionopaga]